VTDEAALGEGRVERHDFLGQKGTEGMFLVTVYKMKESVGIKDMRELTQATEKLNRDSAPIAPTSDKVRNYVTNDGSSGVIILETDQPDSAWVNQAKQALATWIEFGETERMEVFKLASFKFRTGPRERGRVG
jgi:hypothetical protein